MGLLSAPVVLTIGAFLIFVCQIVAKRLARLATFRGVLATFGKLWQHLATFQQAVHSDHQPLTSNVAKLATLPSLYK